MRPGSGVRASLTLMPELNLYPRLFPLWFLILSCNYLMSIPGPEVRDPRKVTGKWQKERLGPPDQHPGSSTWPLSPTLCTLTWAVRLGEKTKCTSSLAVTDPREGG